MRLWGPAVAVTILLAGSTGSAWAETTLLVCPARNGNFEFTVDFDQKTVSSSSEGAAYTVPAEITDTTISWTPPGGNAYPSTISRVTGELRRGGALISECRKAEPKF